MGNQSTKAIVSVIVPVYNAAPYLEQCLDGIRSQTLTDIEIICVDDGSTDKSPEILKEYAEKDDRFRIITQTNIGLGGARNRGLDKANGKYLSFLDADDIFEPGMLKNAVDVCEKYDADYCAFLYDTDIERTDNTKSFGRGINLALLPANVPFSKENISHDIFNIFNTAVWNKVYRMDFIKSNNIRFQEMRKAEDVYFSGAALIHAKKIVAIGRCFVHYRTNVATSITNSINDTPWGCAQEGALAIKDLLQEKGIYETYRRDLINHVLFLYLYLLDHLKGKNYIDCIETINSSWGDAFGLFSEEAEFFYDRFSYLRLEKIKSRDPLACALFDRAVYLSQRNDWMLAAFQQKNLVAERDQAIGKISNSKAYKAGKAITTLGGLIKEKK